MTRMLSPVLAFAVGFGLASALILLDRFERPTPVPQAAVLDAAPWTQHRAGPVLAQESAEMRALRAAGRMALLDVTLAHGPR